jgi:hypothetical protein
MPIGSHRRSRAELREVMIEVPARQLAPQTAAHPAKLLVNASGGPWIDPAFRPRENVDHEYLKWGYRTIPDTGCVGSSPSAIRNAVLEAQAFHPTSGIKTAVLRSLAGTCRGLLRYSSRHGRSRNSSALLGSQVWYSQS